MTKHFLRDYTGLSFEAKQLGEQLEFWKSKAYCANVSNIDGMPKGAGVSDPTAKYACKIQELEYELERKKIEVAVRMAQIEEAIDSLSPFSRYILREYYIKNKTWEQIAVDTNYSIQRIWQIHGEALKKIRDY